MSRRRRLAEDSPADPTGGVGEDGPSGADDDDDDEGDSDAAGEPAPPGRWWAWGQQPWVHTLTEDDVPDWLQLKHIRRGYRPPGMTLFQCWASLFTWHNQTLNSWTMVAVGGADGYGGWSCGDANGAPDRSLEGRRR